MPATSGFDIYTMSDITCQSRMRIRLIIDHIDYVYVVYMIYGLICAGTGSYTIS